MRGSNFGIVNWVVRFAAVLTTALAAGCGGGGGGGGAPAPGTLGVSLTDAPACGYDAVNVTVVKVRVHQSSSASENDAGWTDITLNPPRKINLLNLMNGVLENLGETPLAAGHYTQVRLVLDPNTALGLANSVVPTGSTETALVTPSAVQSGIKLINQFQVEAGKRVDLVLDFDACRSVVRRGNGTYALKPVVRVIPTALSGISGFLDMTGLLDSGVTVTAQQNGEIRQSTAPSTTTGEFFLARLEPGNYDVVISANNRATAVITGVPVPGPTANIAAVSDAGARITLATSGTANASGDVASTITPESPIAATVAAKQTLGTAGPTVTVGFTVVDDLAPGPYALTLPTGAPKLGAFGTLPITFADQAGVAGKYTLVASAPGYTPDSADVDLGAGNVTQDFALAPVPAP